MAIKAMAPTWHPSSNGILRARSAGPVHARRMGDLRTACGQLAESWPMLLQDRFDPSDRSACRSCAARVRPALAAARLRPS